MEKITKKNLVGKYIFLMYMTTSGTSEVYGKVNDIRKGNGYIDILLFPVDSYHGSAKKEIHHSLITIPRLLEGTFYLETVRSYRACLKRIKLSD
jgi:hypothetical protein